MNALIFAAGLGTRLKPFTDTLPKALLPLAGKTLLQYQIEKLKQVGIDHITINVHHFAEELIRYVHQNRDFDCHISFSDEREGLLETGGGLRHAKPFLCNNEPIFLCNVDILSNLDIVSLLDTCDKHTLGTLVVSPRETQRYLLWDNENYLSGWTNVATNDVRPANIQPDNFKKLAFSGIQILSPNMFDLLEKVAEVYGDKFSLIDAYMYIIENHLGTFKGYVPPHYRMMDVGKIEQLSQAEQFAKQLSIK